MSERWRMIGGRLEDNIGRYKVGRDWIGGGLRGGEEWRIEGMEDWGRGFVRYVFIRCAEHLFDNGSQ